ncbi:hypothetical protein PY257_03850 [Ramlibacter sp. H39-3-26]|uniref:hypothetical protein n=1 Tax=Curvibacter soli TaxID=3031331 RepID=UPI0023DCC004|nr:hypothetical protein [Ramlibacter sp. H39-3-26]MDF1484319.1 hypothetical protein [Ramlibacter sp. H39-3-26]
MNAAAAPPREAPGVPAACAGHAAMESAAFPAPVRVLAILVVAGLAAFALWSLPALRGAAWSAGSLALFALAGLCIAWTGWWIVHGKTRFDGVRISQSWLWGPKSAEVHDVAHLKLVHWQALERIVAPRLLVRRRNGSLTWFHAADARLLTAFAARVADGMGKAPQG